MTYAIERLFDDIEEKGMEKGIAKIVKNAIRKGMNLDDIIELTGLTVEEIEKIREEIQE